jgi:hypothetical protein
LAVGGESVGQVPHFFRSFLSVAAVAAAAGEVFGMWRRHSLTHIRFGSAERNSFPLGYLVIIDGEFPST